MTPKHWCTFHWMREQKDEGLPLVFPSTTLPRSFANGQPGTTFLNNPAGNQTAHRARGLETGAQARPGPSLTPWMAEQSDTALASRPRPLSDKGSTPASPRVSQEPPPQTRSRSAATMRLEFWQQAYWWMFL